MNRKICGYITWGKNLYWTDIFSGENRGTRICGIGILWEENVRFSDGRRDTPPEHEFSCRFGNIRSIRVIGDKRIELGVKGEMSLRLERGRSLAIGNWIAVEPRNGKIENVVWEHISEIVFSAALIRLTSRKTIQSRVSWKRLTGCTRAYSMGFG